MKRYLLAFAIVLLLASPTFAQCPGICRAPVRKVLAVAVAPLKLVKVQPVRKILKGVKARVENRRARRAARRGN